MHDKTLLMWLLVASFVSLAKKRTAPQQDLGER
jgi:hypothetical protein